MALCDNSAAENSAAEISQREENNSNNSPISLQKTTEGSSGSVKGARIYDSEIGKTCHQCRQRRKDFAAFCKKTRNDKPCPLTYCHKCLLNRYGEKADEVGKLEDWNCPKCRGVCNCSMCMKKKGYQPTGILSHTAKATGFNSVHELLYKKGAEVLEPWSAQSTASPKKYFHSNKGSPALKRSRDKENHCVEQNEAGPNEEGSAKKENNEGAKRLKYGENDGTQMPVAADGGIAEARPPKSRKLRKGGTEKENGLTEANVKEEEVENGLTSVGDSKAKPSPKVHKSKKLAVRAHNESIREDIVLPQSMPLTEVAGTELPDQDVGAALQFLEFCKSFSEILDIKKGQPECILRDLTRGRIKRHGVLSAHVEFNIKLLSLIYKDTKKDGDAWVQILKQCIEESECTMEELPLDFLDRGSSGYDNLEPSEKLKILNFLCDEVLGTEELRKWIDEVAVKFDEGRKESKEKVFAAKRQEKLLKQKVKDETAKAMLSAREGTPLSLSEFDDLLSQLRTEADKVHADVLASLELVPKKNQRSDAVRTDHVMLGINGQIFWKLSGYNNCSNIILQDIGNWDSVTPQDKWFIFNDEEEKVVEKYISSLRNPTLIRYRSDHVDEGMKSDSSDSPEPKLCTKSDSSDSPGPKLCMKSDSDSPGPKLCSPKEETEA